MTQLSRTGWIIAVSGILVGTFFLSPVMLFALGRAIHENWVTASNIRQAYGFASAVLSGLALLAVAYSLIAQQHDSRLTRIENQRALHTELLRMAIDDPSLIGVLMTGPSRNLDSKRRFLYVDLIYQAMRADYVNSRIFNDDETRNEPDLPCVWTSVRVTSGDRTAWLTSPRNSVEVSPMARGTKLWLMTSAHSSRPMASCNSTCSLCAATSIGPATHIEATVSARRSGLWKGSTAEAPEDHGGQPVRACSGERNAAR
jgi:hypothetical protein